MCKMIISTVLIFLLINTVIPGNATKCPLVLSLDITNGEYLDNGVIINDGLSYEPNVQFSHNGSVRGCVCEIKPCIRKCCPRGQAMVNTTCTTYSSKFPLEVYNGTNPISVPDDHFHYIYNNECDSKGFYEKHQFYIQANGKIYRPFATNKGKEVGPEQYCLDLVIDGKNENISALVCLNEEDKVNYSEHSYGLFVLMVCLLVTFLVYAILPERSIHEKSLMCLLISLFGGCSMVIFAMFYPYVVNEYICKMIGLSYIYLYIASLFWMNAMCIDIWRTFSDLRGFSRGKKVELKRFLLYSGYAWGMPLILILIIICLILDKNIPPDAWYDPGMEAGECWLKDGIPVLLYYHLPETLLILSNIILFSLTAWKIRQVQQKTAILRNGESRKHTYENEKQRFILYLKLMLIMGVSRGVNCALQITTWVIGYQNAPRFVGYLDDIFDALYGICIFLICVCTRTIWKRLKQRYYLMTGKANLTRTSQTTYTASTIDK